SKNDRPRLCCCHRGSPFPSLFSGRPKPLVLARLNEVPARITPMTASLNRRPKCWRTSYITALPAGWDAVAAPAATPLAELNGRGSDSTSLNQNSAWALLPLALLDLPSPYPRL